ncbi:NUDIX hydrolase [Shewanella sp. Scap07]|uniref:NUDIX hydrolase n=1 Tax=Shewanella sp. Scap07 TaxID=2589987 RepID=UPI0015B8FF8C|nr:NUDIX hydrolase [Shewanella sp. Scap07]QLE85828.1 NUDIX hydrolase [Shewanella sp. Scap07]
MTERYKPNTTVACVVHCQGRYLMVEEIIDGQLRYNQPAGHLEANESIIDACVRECLEETGLTLSPDHLLAIYQFSANDSLAFVRYTFVVELNEPLASAPIDTAINRTLWLSAAEINQRADKLRSPLVMQSITDHQNGKHFPLTLLNSRFL